MTAVHRPKTVKPDARLEIHRGSHYAGIHTSCLNSQQQINKLIDWCIETELVMSRGQEIPTGALCKILARRRTYAHNYTALEDLA